MHIKWRSIYWSSSFVCVFRFFFLSIIPFIIIVVISVIWSVQAALVSACWSKMGHCNDQQRPSGFYYCRIFSHFIAGAKEFFFSRLNRIRSAPITAWHSHFINLFPARKLSFIVNLSFITNLSLWSEWHTLTQCSLTLEDRDRAGRERKSEWMGEKSARSRQIIFGFRLYKLRLKQCKHLAIGSRWRTKETNNLFVLFINPYVGNKNDTTFAISLKFNAEIKSNVRVSNRLVIDINCRYATRNDQHQTRFTQHKPTIWNSFFLCGSLVTLM